MADVSKYATANVDRELYMKFKKACVNEDISILDAMNALMERFINNECAVVKEDYK